MSLTRGFLLALCLGVFGCAAGRNTLRCSSSEGGTDFCVHGRCLTELVPYPVCSCYGSDPVDEISVVGAWAGEFCTECQFGYFGPHCNQRCPGYDDGVATCTVCSGHGICSMGTVGDGHCHCRGSFTGLDCSLCSPGYWGEDCSAPCPGLLESGLPCFGRGTCSAGSSGSGNCACAKGYGGVDCYTCDEAHFGPHCQHECHGTISEVAITANFSDFVLGTVTETSNDDYLDIQESANIVLYKACSSHGFCQSGTHPEANGSCTCNVGFGGSNCSHGCPTDSAGQFCGGASRGACSWGSDTPMATCQCIGNWMEPACTTCKPGFTGSQCDVQCLVNSGSGEICSGRGECFQSLQGGASCNCSRGFTGSVCQSACPGDPPCSGHGSCTLAGNTPVCTCTQSEQEGFWTGDRCDRCSVSHNNSLGCVKPCPKSGQGEVCNGHGTCVNGACICDASDENNLWCNTPSTLDGACESQLCAPMTCPIYYSYGSECKVCPGTTGERSICTNHGYCDYGKYQSGQCTCYDGYGGTQCNLRCPTGKMGLVCSGDGRGKCLTNPQTRQPYCHCYQPDRFKGLACELDCPLAAGKICSGNGDCGGDGFCSCSAGWTGKACSVPCTCAVNSGDCDQAECGDNLPTEACSSCVCRGNFGGPLCMDCRDGFHGEECNSICLKPGGRTVGRKCICQGNYGGDSCQALCPSFEGRLCNSQGHCDADSGKCVCYSDANGVQLYFGPACTTECSLSSCLKTFGSVHPACSDSGCVCQDSSAGHYGGFPGCADCKPGYWGLTCTERCNCNDHGLCDRASGRCRCFDSEKDGFFAGDRCETCATGFLGSSCKTRNVALREVPRQVSGLASTTKFQPSFGHVFPQTLAIDVSRAALYAGGTPMYRLGVEGVDIKSEETTLSNALQQKQSDGFPLYSGGLLCDPGLVMSVAIRELFVFSLMQSSSACNSPLRIVRTSRVGDDSFSLSQTLLGVGSQFNSTEQVIAAADDLSQDVSKRSYFVFAVAQPRSTDEDDFAFFPGGKVVVIDLATGGIPRIFDLVSSGYPTFQIESVALKLDTTSGEPVVLIGGSSVQSSSQTREWDLLSLRGYNNPTVLSFRDSSSYGDSIKCWPQLGSNSSSLETQGCLHCYAVEKVQFLPMFSRTGIPPALSSSRALSQTRAFVLSMRRRESVNRTPLSPIVAWVQDTTGTVAGQQIVALDSDDVCREGYVMTSTTPEGVPLPPSGRTSLSEDSSPQWPIRGPSYYVQLAEVPTTPPDQSHARATAMAIDTIGWTLFVAYHRFVYVDELNKLNPNTFDDIKMPLQSFLVKVRLAQARFEAYGNHPLGFVDDDGSSLSSTTRVSSSVTPAVFSALAMDESARILYGLSAGTPWFDLKSFLSYDIEQITPSVAAQVGGTNVTLKGNGFIIPTKLGSSQSQGTESTNDHWSPFCRFGASPPVSATILDSHTIECTASAFGLDSETGDDSSGCAGQTLEVTLYGSSPTSSLSSSSTDRGSAWYSSSGITIQRPPAARLDEVPSPDRGGSAGGAVVTLHGKGFYPSSSALCKFFSRGDGAPEPLMTAATFVSPSEVTCIQPAASPAMVAKMFDSRVDYAGDGDLYTGTSQPFQFVGAAANISVLESVPVRADAFEFNGTFGAQFNLSVLVVDAQNRRLGDLDNTFHLVRLKQNVSETDCDPALFSWREESDGFPWPPCRPNNLDWAGDLNPTWELQTRGGEVSFANLRLKSARAATVSVEFMAPLDQDWVAVGEIIVMPGAEYALAISNRRELEGAKRFFAGGGQPIATIEVIVIDRLANIVQRPGQIKVKAEVFYEFPSSDGLERVDTSSVLVTHRDDAGNKIRFPEIYLKFINGVKHFVNFSSTNRPNILSTVTPPLETALCDGTTGEYKVSLTSKCESCPPQGAICNGTEIIRVKPGFWRSSTTDIYQCEDPSACLGGTEAVTPCREGHYGPLCNLCNASYGKAGAGECVECPSLGAAWAALLGGGFVFIAVLLVWTTVTLRKAEVSDLSVILRTIVNHMQATGKLGEFSQKWGVVLQTIFSIQGTGSDISINGLASVDCLLKHYESDYRAVFGFYMGLPILSLLLALLVFGVVRGFKMKPVITKRLRDEIHEELKVMPTSTAGDLLQKYPFYFVLVTTFCVHMFAMYQTFITQSTRVLECRTVVLGRKILSDGDTEVQSASFVDVDMTIPCDEDGHHPMRTAALVCSIGYGLGIPLVFIFGHRFVDSRINRPELTKLMFMFLIGGYRDKYWFWQATIMVRKLLLVLIVVFMEDKKQLQSYMGMWIMVCALVLQLYFNPNSKKEHNQVEALSLSIICITLNLSLLYYWDGMNEGLELALTIVLIIITLLAFILFAYYLRVPVMDTVRETLDIGKHTARRFLRGERGIDTEAEEDEEVLRQAEFERQRGLGPRANRDASRRLRIRGIFDEGDDVEETVEPIAAPPTTKFSNRNGPRQDNALFDEVDDDHIASRSTTRASRRQDRIPSQVMESMMNDL